MTEAAASPGRPPLRRVVLLGQTGFIGQAVQALCQRHCPPRVTLDETLPRLDLTDPQAALTLADHVDAQTAVVMMAGIKRQLGDSLDLFEQNLAMVTTLCRVLQERPVGRVVYLSSSAVYGEEVANRAINEATPVQPASYYGLSKFAAEGLLRKAAASHPGCTLAILRPPLVYGWNDGGTIYGPSGFTKSALEGRAITLWGDGSELREFFLVDDLAMIIYRLTFHDFDGIVNIATGRSRTYQDILTILRRHFGDRLRVTSRPRSRQQVDNEYDNRLLRRLLPDFAFASLEEGIARTLAGFQAALPAASGAC